MGVRRRAILVSRDNGRDNEPIKIAEGSACQQGGSVAVGDGGGGVIEGEEYQHSRPRSCTDIGQPGDSNKNPRKSRKRDWVKVLFAARNLATVVYALSYTVTLPLLPFMANRHIYPREPDENIPGDMGSPGVSEAWRGLAYGLVMSGYYITKMVAAPWIGFLSDKMGRRQALVVTLLGGGFSFLVTALVGQYSIQGIILCRLLMGCFAANGALMHAYIRDTVQPEWHSFAFSQQSACWGLAYLLAAPLLAYWGDDTNTVLALATTSMVVAATIVQVRFVDTAKIKRGESWWARMTAKPVVNDEWGGAGVGVGSGKVKARAGAGAKAGAGAGAGIGVQGTKVEAADTTGGYNGWGEGGGGDASSGDMSEGRRRGKVAWRGIMTRSAAAAEKALREDNEGGDREENKVQGGGRGGNGLGHQKGSALVPCEGEYRHPQRGGGGGAQHSGPRGARKVGSGVGTGDRAGGGGGGGGRDSSESNGASTGGRGKGGGGGSERQLGNRRALMNVFQRMMQERLVLATFLLQTLRPAQDLAPLVAHKFSGGAGMLAGISSVRAVCRVVVPMTPLIPFLVNKGFSGNDRLVAASMSVAIAALAAAIPRCEVLQSLHRVMALKGLCHIIRDSVMGAVLTRVAGASNVGAFFGWQHFMKAVSGALSHMVTGYISGLDLALPYYITAVCDLGYAVAYLYA